MDERVKIKIKRREMSEDGKRKHVFVNKNSCSYRKCVVETDCLSQVVNCNQP